MYEKKNVIPYELLLVEDNPGDVRLTREALKDALLPINLNVVEDGMEAMAFLHHDDRYLSAPHPDLILLDLNLPKKNGREVLAEIKNDIDLRRIPIVILTTSRAEDDILTTYDLRANCYVNKPIDLDKFINTIRTIENFWLSTVRLPPHVTENMSLQVKREATYGRS